MCLASKALGQFLRIKKKTKAFHNFLRSIIELKILHKITLRCPKNEMFENDKGEIDYTESEKRKCNKARLFYEGVEKAKSCLCKS